MLEERQLVALPASHPLAAHTGLRLADLEAGHVREPKSVLWRPRELSGRERPHLGDMSHLLRFIELGELIALLPASAAEAFGRPGIAYRPVIDAEPSRLSVAWPRSSRSVATAAFVRVVTDLAAGRRATPAPRAV